MIGGELINKAVPYLVSILNDGQHICGGTLLSNNIVITAAHCQIREGIDEIIFNTSNILNINNNIQRSIIKKVVKHENYSEDQYSFDISILKLETNINQHYNIKLAEQSDLIDNEVYITMGFGFTSEDSDQFSGELFQTKAPKIEQSYCQSLDEVVGNDHLCVKNLEKIQGFCDGDSGGPLVKQVNGEFILAGIVNYSIGCGRINSPDVYASIPYYSEWIKNTINNINN